MKRTGRTAANDLLSQGKDLNHLTTALSTLRKTHTAAMQWILSYSKVVGNEIVGRLAKEESTKEQVCKSTAYKEAKTVIKTCEVTMVFRHNSSLV